MDDPEDAVTESEDPSSLAPAAPGWNGSVACRRRGYSGLCTRFAAAAAAAAAPAAATAADAETEDANDVPSEKWCGGARRRECIAAVSDTVPRSAWASRNVHVGEDEAERAIGDPRSCCCCCCWMMGPRRR